MSIKEEKIELRKRILKLRNQLSLEYRTHESARIVDELISLVEQEGAKVVHAFIPMGFEVDIKPFLEELLRLGVSVYCPKTLPSRQLENRMLTSLNELENGVFGTQHPKSDQEYKGAYDLIIVPGVAFDKNGNRLGYGGGYYDTFIEENSTAKTVAVCFKDQLLDEVPVEQHDVIMKQVIY